jgi:hypothetical protein
MREKPILFSTPMVKAILDGRKTMTRRVVKAPVLYKVVAPPSLISQVGDVWEFLWNGKMVGGGFKIKPPYSVGDLLWVRETWRRYSRSECTCYEYCQCPPDGTFLYFADWGPNESKWKPSIHMPKTAARIWLEVTSVRVERLQEITEEDAVKEGIKNVFERNPHYDGTIGSAIKINHLTQFRELWDSINAKRGYGWDVNPWVWVIEFKRVDHD